MNYMGDFLEDATVYITFNTFDSNDPSASVTITDLAAGDVEIWKNGVVQTTSGAGVTLTLNIGTNNGTHLIAVDTSNTTDGGFYVISADYQVRINGTTIDGATVNAWVGSFSIENRFKEVNVVKWLNQAVTLSGNNKPDVNVDEISDDQTAASNLELMYDGTGYAGGTIVSKADLTKIGGDAQSATDLKDFADVGYDPTNNVTQSDLIYIHGTALTETAGRLAAAFIKLFDVATPTLVASDVMVGTDGANTVEPDATGTAAGLHATTDAKIDTTDGLIGTAQSDLNIITGTSGVVIQDGTITEAKLGADCITNAKIADDAIGAENLATDAIGADALAADAITEIWSKAMTDLAQGAPSSTASVLTAINYLYESWRNKTETTATRITIYKDDGATELVRSTISDDTTTFSKEELVSGV